MGHGRFVVSFARSTPTPTCHETAGAVLAECAVALTASAQTAGVRRDVRSNWNGPDRCDRSGLAMDGNGPDRHGLTETDYQIRTGRKMINMEISKTCGIIAMKQKYFNKNILENAFGNDCTS